METAQPGNLKEYEESMWKNLREGSTAQVLGPERFGMKKQRSIIDPKAVLKRGKSPPLGYSLWGRGF